MANRREFEGRMLAILDPAIKRAGPSRRQTLLLMFGLGSMALTIAAISPERRPATPVQQNSVVLSNDTSVADTVPPVPADQIAARARTKTPSATPSATASPSPSPSPSVDLGWPQQGQGRVQWQGLGQGLAQGQGPDTALLGRVLRTDKSEDVRRAAAWALQRRRDGVPLLLERLRIDEDESVREMAAWALAGMGNKQIEAAIVEALRKDPSHEVRQTAAWALGQLHNGDNVAALEAALSDASSEVRFKALWALGQHRITDVPPKAVALLQDTDQEVRVMSAWLLGQVQDKATLPALRAAFLKEEDREAQEAQFRALLFMGDRSQEVIDRAMKSDNSDLRARAVRMIAGHGTGSWPWPWPWPDPRPSP